MGRKKRHVIHQFFPMRRILFKKVSLYIYIARNQVYEAIHTAFEWLPLAAVVGKSVLVLHGGIGDGTWSVDDLNAVCRPIKECDDGSVPACVYQVRVCVCVCVCARARVFVPRYTHYTRTHTHIHTHTHTHRHCGPTPAIQMQKWPTVCTLTRHVATEACPRPCFLGPILRPVSVSGIDSSSSSDLTSLSARGSNLCTVSRKTYFAYPFKNT